MTTTTDRETLTATVERLGAELNQALQDVALLQRLKTAEADADRLAIELRAAQEELIQANVTAVQEKRAAAYANYQGITVSSGAGIGLHSSFTIQVTKLTYNGRESVPVTHTVNGFAGLPPQDFGYLIDVHPEQIPSFIKALAPGDIYEAFSRYFVSMKRGYLSTAAA